MSNRIVKKAIVWMMTLSIFFSVVGTANAVSVNDIDGHWAEETIASWLNQSFVKGYEDGTFRPDAKITREEFTALVNRSFGFVESETIQFNDVSENNGSYLDISKGVKAGYITGYPDGTFKPIKEISREEVAVMIQTLLGISSSESNVTYTDKNSIPTWSKEAIDAVSNLEIMVGYPDGSFQPLGLTSRAEAVVILERALKLKAEQDIVIDPIDVTEPTPSQPAIGTPVNLGTAGSYVILAKTGISSVPASVVTGDIGVSPMDSTGITGFSLTMDATNEFSISNQIIGKAYASDYTSPTPSNLTTAISNMETAYTDAAGRAADYTELHAGNIMFAATFYVGKKACFHH